MPPPSQRERAEQKRRERLESMEEQVRDGSLVIRQMTPEERKHWKPPAPDSRPGRARRKR